MGVRLRLLHSASRQVFVDFKMLKVKVRLPGIFLRHAGFFRLVGRDVKSPQLVPKQVLNWGVMVLLQVVRELLQVLSLWEFRCRVTAGPSGGACGNVYFLGRAEAVNQERWLRRLQYPWHRSSKFNFLWGFCQHCCALAVITLLSPPRHLKVGSMYRRGTYRSMFPLQATP